MKFKTTKKNMKEYEQIICVSYCSLRHLLQFQDPIAYSTRAEGWACDYYDINGVLISTGYAPLSSKNTNASYDMIKKYDDKARQILTNAKAGDYYAPAKKITKLLYKFIDEATKER